MLIIIELVINGVFTLNTISHTVFQMRLRMSRTQFVRWSLKTIVHYMTGFLTV